MSFQRKRVKNGGDISTDLEALRVEDPDSSVQTPTAALPQMTYASTLKNPVDRYRQTMMEDFEFTDDDCSYSVGKHGLNISFSEKVHNKLDFDWRCAVIVKLMGKPNSTNTFDFMLRGLRRKWQVKGGWQLIDLPNDFFIVKFNLEEDMNYALCGGPWILAGQTLIVRKWRPDFDPMNEFIGKMALWVRIFGLPVKYFKEFTVAKIGKILGDVVKVDKLTIGQSRGKFARVCIEIDLNKPLRPYVEVESAAYNVVYEGISLICFECGCFGHSKDKCPTLKVPANDNFVQHGSSNDTALPHTNGSASVVPSDVSMASVQNGLVSPPPCDVIEEDMGPWMLMSYRNKKKSSDTGATKKNGNSGSRFSVLQNESGMESDMPEKTIKDNPVETAPPVGKLWKSFQEKRKVASVSTKAKSAIDTDATLKSSELPGNHSPTKITSVFSDNSNMKSKNLSRLPMKDISNIGSCSGSKVDVHYQRKTKGANSVTKHQPNVFKKLSFENVGSNAFGDGISAIFGHCPPEESLSNVDLQSSINHDSESFVEKTFSANSMLTGNDDLPSHNGESMVDA